MQNKRIFKLYSLSGWQNGLKFEMMKGKWIAVSRSHSTLLPTRCSLWAACRPLSFRVMSFRRTTLSFTERVSCSTKEFLSIFSYNREERSYYTYGWKNITNNKQEHNSMKCIYTLFLHFLMAWMINLMDRLKRTINKTGKSSSTAYTKAGVYLEDWVFTRVFKSSPLGRSGHVMAQTGSRESTQDLD